MTAITLDTVTDPIDTTNVTAVVASGTTDVGTNTVTVTIVDSAGATVGPVSATVALTTWAIPTTNVSALADGTLVYEATATSLTSVQAFAAKAAQKHTAVANYITDAELRAYLGDPSSTQDSGPIADAIAAASREVEAFTGRHFYQRTETQYFSPDPGNLWVLYLDDMDLATTSGLTVTSQFANSANYGTTWTINTDFICEPVNQSVNGIDGWPYTWLRSLGGKIWPPQVLPFYRDTVKVTGTWGWVQTPLPVKQATKILAAQFYKLGGAPFGVAGWGAFGDIRVKDIPQVASLLAPFRKQTTLLMA